MAMEDVVTGIDGLLNYINDNGEADITALASSLKVTESTIQEWALVLEKAKLVRIVYKMGKMYVTPVNVSVDVSELTEKQEGNATHFEKMTPEETKKLIEVKSTILKNQIKGNEKTIDTLTPRIKELKAYIQDVQKSFSNKSVELNKYLNELQAIKNQAMKNYQDIEGYKQGIGGTVNNLSAGTGNGENEKLVLQRVDESVKNADAMIKDISNKAAMLHSSTESLLQQFEKKTNEERSKLRAFAGDVEHEAKRLDELAQSTELQLEEYKRKTESYRRSMELQDNKLSKSRTAILDRAIKAKKNIDGMYELADKKIADLDSRISKEISDLKNLADLDKGIKDLRASVDSLAADKEAIEKEMDELTKALDGLTKNAGINVTKKHKELTEIENRVKNLQSSTVKINDKNKEINASIDNLTKKGSD